MILMIKMKILPLKNEPEFKRWVSDLIVPAKVDQIQSKMQPK